MSYKPNPARPLGSPWHIHAVTYHESPFAGLQGCVGRTTRVSGWAAAMLTVLHSPVSALIHLSVRQVLCPLELFPFKYQKKAQIIQDLNYFVFSHSETLAGLINFTAPSNQMRAKQVLHRFGKRNLSFSSVPAQQTPSEACLKLSPRMAPTRRG